MTRPKRCHCAAPSRHRYWNKKHTLTDSEAQQKHRARVYGPPPSATALQTAACVLDVKHDHSYAKVQFSEAMEEFRKCRTVSDLHNNDTIKEDHLFNYLKRKTDTHTMLKFGTCLDSSFDGPLFDSKPSFTRKDIKVLYRVFPHFQAKFARSTFII